MPSLMLETTTTVKIEFAIETINKIKTKINNILIMKLFFTFLKTLINIIMLPIINKLLMKVIQYKGSKFFKSILTKYILDNNELRNSYLYFVIVLNKERRFKNTNKLE